LFVITELMLILFCSFDDIGNIGWLAGGVKAGISWRLEMAVMAA
jgi:hypothetical protein